MKVFTWRQQLGDPKCPYAERWMINFGPLGSIRLHHWFRSDDKRAKHDHPCDFITLVLKGGYIDESHCEECSSTYEELSPLEGGHPPVPCAHCNSTRTVKEYMRPGALKRRSAYHRHTVNVLSGGCWTLLYFWPERREWGFWVPRKDNGKLRFRKHNKYFYEHGHHPCDQP